MKRENVREIICVDAAGVLLMPTTDGKGFRPNVGLLAALEECSQAGKTITFLNDDEAQKNRRLMDKLQDICPKSNLLRVSDIFTTLAFKDLTVRLAIGAAPRKDFEAKFALTAKGYLHAAPEGHVIENTTFYRTNIARNLTPRRLGSV